MFTAIPLISKSLDHSCPIILSFKQKKFGNYFKLVTMQYVLGTDVTSMKNIHRSYE
jgi:hypothetical protein